MHAPSTISACALTTCCVPTLARTVASLSLDGSGFIEVVEVREMLSSVYNGDVPPHEVNTMMSLFDTDGDGKISWCVCTLCAICHRASAA